MKTYITDILPKIQKFSKDLDDLTLLTNQHWVVIDEINTVKIIYYFKTNNELLISRNGIVEKGKWELLSNNSIIIDKENQSYLFKHGFLDKNILALKIDTKEEYVFLINENKYNGNLNSFNKIIDFLNKQYPNQKEKNKSNVLSQNEFRYENLKTDKGFLKIKTQQKIDFTSGDEVFINEKVAPDGKYTFGWPSWLNSLTIKNGKIKL